MSADISIPPAAESPAPGTGSPGESEPAAASASPRRRRFRPRHAIIAGIALVLLLFAGWTGITYWQLVSASNSFDEGDFAASEAAGHRFLEMSPFEAHKGHFAIGTARAADGDLDTAHSELETALSTAPPADECAVRINLALVQETQGNDFRDAEDTDAANERYDAATATLTNAPEECRPSGSGTDERMSQQEERVGESQEQMNNPQEPGKGEDGGGEGEGGDSGEDGGQSGGGGQSGESSGGDTGEQQGGSGGDDPQSGESGEEDERLKELEKRSRESEQRHSETNGGGSGSGVRQPGSKPW